MPDKQEGGLLKAIGAALQALEPAELEMFTLATLHGVPLRELTSREWPQEKCQTAIIST